MALLQIHTACRAGNHITGLRVSGKIGLAANLSCSVLYRNWLGGNHRFLKAESDDLIDYHLHELSTMAMKIPPHPGSSIKINCLDPLGLNVTEAAKVLGVARHTLSRVLNGHAGISPEMAIRLEKAGWSNAGFWLQRQTAYDLAQARRNEDQIKVERYRPHAV